MTDFTIEDFKLEDVLSDVQSAQKDVETYDSKDKVEETKKKEEKKAAKEQQKILKEALKQEEKAAKVKTSATNDDEQIIKLKKKIKEYETNKVLGPHLEQCGFKFDKALSHNDVAKLEKQIAKIEKLLSGRTAEDGINSGIKLVMTGLERMISSKSSADINGLTQCCFENQQWVFLLERVKMKYGINGLSLGGDPGFDLLLSTLITGMSVYQMNQLKKHVTKDTSKYNLDAPIAPQKVSADPVDTTRPPAPGLGNMF